MMLGLPTEDWYSASPPARLRVEEAIRRARTSELVALLSSSAARLNQALPVHLLHHAPRLDRPLIEALVEARVGLDRIASHPEAGVSEVELALRFSGERRGRREVDVGELLGLLGVAVRRNLVPLDTRLPELLKGEVRRLQNAEGRTAPAYSGPRRVSEVLEAHRRRLEQAIREAESEEGLHHRLLAHYVQDLGGVAELRRDPAGSLVVRHPHALLAETRRLVAEYPNPGLAHTLAEVTVEEGRELARDAGIRPLLHAYANHSWAQEALVRTPVREDFEEMLGRLRTQGRQYRRSLFDPRLTPESLAWLPREWLAELLQDEAAEIRLKAIRALGRPPERGGGR